MWKLLTGISLTLLTVAMADAAPPARSVSVECCGRLRHGVFAIGGETTGTTITFNRMVWELLLNDDTQRKFAEEHGKELVIVTGTLRKIAGTEVKVRWIIDVETLSERDAAKHKEGVQLTVQGTLRATGPRSDESAEMTIDANGHVWPIDLSADARLHGKAVSLVDQPVLLTGSLEHVAEKEPDSDEELPPPVVIRVKTLKPSADAPVESR